MIRVRVAVIRVVVVTAANRIMKVNCLEVLVSRANPTTPTASRDVTGPESEGVVSRDPWTIMNW